MQNVSCKSWIYAIKWKALCSVIMMKETSRVSQSPHITCRFATLSPIITRSLTNLTWQAMQRAGVSDPSKCLFVDDSFSNVEGAKNVGWIRSVHFREVGPDTVQESEVKRIARDQEKLDEVNDLQELREVWPDIFVQAN